MSVSSLGCSFMSALINRVQSAEATAGYPGEDFFRFLARSGNLWVEA
jgi:hypothetical protein